MAKTAPGKLTFTPGDPTIVVNYLTDKLEQNMQLACVYAESKVIKKLQRGQKTVSVKPRDGGPPYRVGLNPSKPNEPPKKVTGRLSDSITHQVERSTFQIVGRIGTNVEYARRLELGFVGTDKAGRSINQAPRPYLRQTIIEERLPIIKILKTGRP